MQRSFLDEQFLEALIVPQLNIAMAFDFELRVLKCELLGSSFKALWLQNCRSLKILDEQNKQFLLIFQDFCSDLYSTTVF